MGEFTDPNGRKGAFEQLRGLNSRAWAAIGCGVIVLLLIVASFTGTKAPNGASALASQPLPMTPSGSYTVGDSYYAGQVSMPNYVGSTLQAAVSDLGSRGIYIGTYDPVYASAIVVRQNPYPGTRVSQSTASSIQLLIPNDTPTATTTPPPPPTTTSEAPSNTDVDVDVDHHNSRDGALTGGFCRKHWWC